MATILFLILLIGLVALYAAHARLRERTVRLERQLENLLSARDQMLWEQRPETVESRREWTPPTPAEPAERPPAPVQRPWIEEPARAAVVEQPAPPPEPVAGLFERFVGGRLLIWIGGIALAVAGVYLVRYTVEIGLVTPEVRMIVAALFGLLLIGAGEVARSRPALAGDPRIAQALVGAGILVLYATAYGALQLYGLIGLGTASALMVAITAGALALSLRHGAPTAVMGLVGGFLTPLLVGDPNSSAVPLLAYLALLNGALFAVASRRGWTWLAAGAAVLSFIWTGLLLFAERGDALAAGLFVVGLAVAASLARPGGGKELRLIQPAAIGLLQLAALVARTDLGLPAWALFGALALASLVLATRRPEYRLLPPFALALALLLLGTRAFMGSDPMLAWVGVATTALFGAFGAWRAKSDDRLLWTLVASTAFALPALVLRAGEGQLLAPALWGLLLALLAIAPAALAWWQRGSARQDGADLPLMVAGTATLALLLAAAPDLLPLDLVGGAWLLLTIGAALAARRLGDRGTMLLALGTAALASVIVVGRVPELWTTILASLAGEPALLTRLPRPERALLLLLVPAALLFLLLRLTPDSERRLRPGLAIAGTVFLLGGLWVLAKQIFSLSSAEEFVARGFAERMLITQALFLAGFLLGRAKKPGLATTGTALTSLAAGRLIWFDLIVHNPTLSNQWVGTLPLLNLLAPAFLGSAAWLYAARRRNAGELSGVWLGGFLVALVAGAMLLVRQAFQGPILTAPASPTAEFYGYSLAGLLLSVALLGAGVRLPDKALRVAGLGLLTATIIKVFLIDAAALEGILRILSFLGLGIALIGVGQLYGKVLSAGAKKAAGGERHPADRT